MPRNKSSMSPDLRSAIQDAFPAGIPVTPPDVPAPPDVELPAAVSGKAIRLARIYQGRRTNEQAILPGEYFTDDPRLWGLADYLLANGHAVEI